MTKVVIVDLKDGATEVTVKDGAKVSDVLANISDSVDVRTGGKDARDIANEPVSEGQRFTTQPKSLKNGS